MGRAGRGESLVWRKFCVFILYFFSLPEVLAHRSPYPRHPLSWPMRRGLRDAERVVPRPARMAQLAGRPCALEGNSTPSRHWPASEQPRVTAGEAQGSEARGCPGAWPGSLRWRRAGKRRRGSADGARVQVSPAAHLSGTAAAARVGSQRGPGPRGAPPPSPRTSRLRSLLSRPPPPVLSVVFQRGAFLPPPPTPGIWGDA